MRYIMNDYTLDFNPATRLFEITHAEQVHGGRLSALEANLLSTIMEHQLHGHSPDSWEIADAVYGPAVPESLKKVSAAIGRLNRKLGAGYIGHVSGADGAGYELFTYPPFREY